MGSTYSQLIQEATKLKSTGKLPFPDRVPQHYFSKSEIKIYQIIRDLYSNPYFVFVMNNAQFLKFLQDWFECENEEIAEQIISMMGISSISNISEVSLEESKGGGVVKYSVPKSKINTFDFLAILILFSKWSIGVKIDMLLILYDTQSNDSISISELLIMIKSVLRIMSSYSSKGSDCINFNLISDEILEIFVEKTWADFINKTIQKIVKDSERNDGIGSTEGEAFMSTFQHYRGNPTKPVSTNISSKKKKSISVINNIAFAGIETQNEKKYRIFKWKALEKHKMSLLYVKHRLIESIEVIIFFNLMNPV